MAERKKFADLFTDVGSAVIRMADVVVMTIAQLGNDIMKGVKFDLAMIDESTTITECQMLMVWHVCVIMVLIGDRHQLGPVAMSSVIQNVFKRVLTMSPYV